MFYLLTYLLQQRLNAVTCRAQEDGFCASASAASVSSSSSQLRSQMIGNRISNIGAIRLNFTIVYNTTNGNISYYQWLLYVRSVQPFWLEGQVYKFQTSRGPDWDAKGTEGKGMGRGCPLRSWLGGLGSIVSSPSRVRGEPRQKTSYGIF